MITRFSMGILGVATIALAACSEAPGEDQSIADMSAEADELTKPLAGQYTTTTELVKFDVPGLPQAQVDQIREMTAGTFGQQRSHCLTQEEVDRGFEDAVRKMGEGMGDMQCTFANFDVDGDKLDAAMNCTGPDGMGMMMKMDGTVEPERSVMQMEMTHQAEMMPGEMNMTMKMTSQRTGDCG